MIDRYIGEREIEMERERERERVRLLSLKRKNFSERYQNTKILTWMVGLLGFLKQ